MAAEERDAARRPRRILRWRSLWIALALAAVGVTAYSLYVGLWYCPDSQDAVVFGQSSLYSEDPGSLRVPVRDQRTGRPVRNASVRISLEGAGGGAELGTFTTDKEGTFSDQFVVPALPPGSYTLTVAVRSGIGKDTIAREVQLKRPCRLYPTTDKPIYQPGQTLHMRAMVLNRETLSPFADRQAVFEVQDPKGNKVYKAAHSTSAYGIASADFEIADSVNLGRYKVSVLAEGVAGEKTVTVERYVLPKFCVRVATDSAWHLPAETFSGTVSASYFFGKPVAGAHVEVVGSTVVEKPVEVLKPAGQTDDAGVMNFSFPLPRYFTGVPLAGRDAFLELQATVTDNAGHAERSAAHLTVAADPIKVQVLPEGGEPVPGVQNLIYILTTYPDGTPAECRVEAKGARLDTDASGLAVVRVTPVRGTWALRGVARDKAGRVAAFERVFSTKPAEGAPVAQRADTARDIFGAARTGNVSRVRYLLRQDPNLANARRDGVPVLHYAAEAAEPTVVRLLLSKGADVDAVEDGSGRTCLHRVAGAHLPSRRIARGREVLHLLTAAGADVNARDARGRTPLFAAAGVGPWTELGPPYGEGGDVRVMDMLIEAGADPSAQDGKGDAVLHYAAGGGDTVAGEALVAAGADPNVKDAGARTPLMLAASEGAAEMCDLLIRSGADVHAADFGGSTALDRAVWHNKWDVATLLLHCGAHHDIHTASGLGEVELVRDFLDRDPTLLNKGGYFDGAPIHWAAAGGRTDVLKLLVGRGASVNAVTAMGWTPLMIAARNGHQQAAGFLLRHGADPGTRDFFARVALHAAVQARSPEVVLALLSAGADVNAQDLNGRTPLDLAVAGGHQELAALLREHGGKENPTPRSLEEVLRLLREGEGTKPDAP